MGSRVRARLGAAGLTPSGGDGADRTRPLRTIVVTHGMQEHYCAGFANALGGHGVAVEMVGAESFDSRLLHDSVAYVDFGQNRRADMSWAAKAWRFALYGAGARGESE